jgi:translation initiation factor 3 subunit B
VGSSSKSELEFWDLDFHSEDLNRKEGASTSAEWGTGSQLLGTADHFGVTDIEWDPSGRYLATSASIWVHTVSSFICLGSLFGSEAV